MIRRLLLIARTIFTEALRRREIYVIVLVTIALLVGLSTIHFFKLAELHKFYFEVALKVMSVATALTTIVLAARQLPREFERRTIYTLLAKPVARWEFIAGKYLGVLAAGIFCLALFMTVFCGAFALGGTSAAGAFSKTLFAQFVYLQALEIAVLAALAFLLSMLMAFDATIVTTMLLYLLGQVLTNALLVLHDYVGAAGRALLVVLNYTIPQPSLFDLSAKVVHEWPPVSMGTLALVTAYAAMFIAPYLALSYGLFRRKAL